MDLAMAEQAASLTPQIRFTMGQIATVTAALSATAPILSGTVMFQGSPPEGFVVHPLTTGESAIIYNAMLTILQARLDALNAALAALN